jgi:hypothetical protein
MFNIILDNEDEVNGVTRVKKSSFSCITKFGIKTTAEDCNLEILRLSEKEPPTSTATISFQSNEGYLETTTIHLQSHHTDQQNVLATPVDLSISTLLRFKTEREHTTLSQPENRPEGNWTTEESFTLNGLTVMNDYIIDTNASSEDEGSGYFPVLEIVRLLGKGTFNNLR